MCLADKKVPNREANVIRKQLSDNFKKIYSMLDDAISKGVTPVSLPPAPEIEAFTRRQIDKRNVKN